MAVINTSYVTQDKIYEEGVSEIAPSLKLDIDDDELVKTIDILIESAEGKKNEVMKLGAKNEKYWKAIQLDPLKTEDWRSQIVDNRIFLSMETIIPIMTARTPEVTVRLKDNELREKVKQMCMNLWEVPNDDDADCAMQANVEMMSRHWMVYHAGVMKYFYDPEIDDVRTVYVHPDKIILDHTADNIYNSRFIAELCEDTLDGLKKRFPAKAKEIQKKFIGTTNSGLSKVTFVEFWTPEYVCYKMQNIILEKKKNPNFDYGDMNTEGVDFNLFKKPRVPYLILNVFNLGKYIYDDTTLIEQAMTLQDGVNKRKNQINDNASDNGVLAGSGDSIDRKVLEAYTGAPNEKLWIREGNVKEALHRLDPKQLPAFVFQDLLDSKGEIDNIFGAHSTTRGERAEPKTLGEAQLLKQGDMGRIDLFTRALDRLAQEWYTAMLHMYLVFKTEPVEIESDDENNVPIIFDRREFINQETGKLMKIRIKVKAGSAMSIDKDSRRAEAVQLAQANLIDPITFFERMDYANPQEMALKLLMWQTNPISLFPEMSEQQQAQEQTQAQQQQETATNTPFPEGTPINIPT